MLNIDQMLSTQLNLQVISKIAASAIYKAHSTILQLNVHII